jgi:signal transduction histidine kinase
MRSRVSVSDQFNTRRLRGGSQPVRAPEGRSEQDHKPTLPESKRKGFAGLKTKLIVPYLILTLLTAMVGTFVVTRLVASSVTERFFNQMYEASRVAADGIVRKEEDHLANLRLMVFSEGVADALVMHDAEALQEILWPLMLNNEVEAVTAVDLEGREVLTISFNSGQEQYNIFKGTDFREIEIVKRILVEESDNLGDKYVGWIETQFGPYFYTSAPVRNESNELVGVLMVGTQVGTFLSELKTQALADIVILVEDGGLLASTFSNDDGIRDRLELSANEIPSIDESFNKDFKVEETNRSYQILYTPVIVRQMRMGTLGIALPSNYVVSAEATSRNTFSLIFSIATVSVIVLGYGLSQSIAKPILKLKSISQAVAQGDLNQRSGFKRSDEIGDLALGFDLMTSRLKRRTAQAARLYQETLQRNEELSRANARLQETQHQLLQSEKLAAVGELTAGIVHDVKNPLAVIKGLTEELLDEEEFSPDTIKQLSTIRESASRASQIVSDLLKFARQSTPEMREQNINDTIKAVVRLTDFLARKGKVEIKLELIPDPVNVIYDATQIEQVLINLIRNSIQAMPNGGLIHIISKREGKWVAIQVKDTGIGIPEQNLRRIFDPFFTTKSEGEGTGLGLSVSYGIISRHNGQIEVASKVGKGTVFTVRLPVTQRVVAREERRKWSRLES